MITTAIAVVMLAGCGGTSAPSLTPRQEATLRSVDALLDGIPQSGTVLGNPQAPVTVQLFADVECANMREFTTRAFGTIVSKWVRPGKVRVVLRSMREGTERPPVFEYQQVAALAAARQNKLWYYLELLYRKQEELPPGEADACAILPGFARGVAQIVPGLNLARWTAARRDPTLAAEIAVDQKAAYAGRFTLSPSLLVGKTGAAPEIELAQFSLTVASRTDPETIGHAVERVLR